MIEIEIKIEIALKTWKENCKRVVEWKSIQNQIIFSSQ